mmetsp:Transcript_7892/g.29208  ORF Transcript_7892/g.29208 Transcript_7892/m.29208 type:complete len:259 (-) Transcript_7892:295-1071(-)
MLERCSGERAQVMVLQPLANGGTLVRVAISSDNRVLHDFTGDRAQVFLTCPQWRPCRLVTGTGVHCEGRFSGSSGHRLRCYRLRLVVLGVCEDNALELGIVGGIDRSKPRLCPQVETGPVCQEELRSLHMAIVGKLVEGCHALLVGNVGFAPPFEQHFHNQSVAFYTRRSQRTNAKGIRVVHFRARVNASLGAFQATACCGEEERPLLRVLSLRIHVCAAHDQLLEQHRIPTAASDVHSLQATCFVAWTADFVRPFRQ